MSEPIRLQSVERNWQAWKGTVLMVGLMSLLMLVSGCYTVIARSAEGSLVDTYRPQTYQPDYAVPETGYMQQAGGYVEEDPGLGAYGVEGYDPQAAEGVGVRYRAYNEGSQDFDYYVVDDPQDVVIVSYRRPWIRRLYVDWYYDWAFGWRPHPVRYGRVWSVGWSFAGFGFYYGSCNWYDPFYWDSYWWDPYWSHGYSVVWGWPPCNPYWDPWWYWDPWHWSHSWYWNAYYDGWYDGYWYGGGGRPGVIVTTDYGRRSSDRRRGLADARTARGAAGSRDAASGRGTTGARTGDRTRVTDGTRVSAPDPRTARNSRTARTGTGTGSSGSDTRATTRIPRTETRPPATDPVERARRTIEQGRGVISGGTVVGGRNTRGSGTGTTPRTGTTTTGMPPGTGKVIAGGQKRTTGRTIGELLRRITGGSATGSSSRSTGTARVRTPANGGSSGGSSARGTVRIPSVPRTSGGTSSRPTVPRTSGGSASRPTTTRPRVSTGTTKVKVPPPRSGGSKVRPSSKGKGKGA